MAIAKKKKRFFDVDMPLIQKQTQLQAYNIEEVDGKYINYDLTRFLKGKSIMLKFKVSVDGDKATSVPRESKVMPYYIRRAIRKGTHYVEDSFSTETKDAHVRIKPFLITRRKVPRSVRKSLRDYARNYLEDYVKQFSYNRVFDEILKNKVQKELSLYLKKVYPLSFCEIRVFRVERDKSQEEMGSQSREQSSPETKNEQGSADSENEKNSPSE